MLYSILSGSGLLEMYRVVIEYVSMGIEAVAVTIIALATVLATVRFFSGRYVARDEEGAYRRLRGRLGRALLVGLEILIAADVVRTVALEATLTNVGVLGLLVLVRTFLSWTLVLEMEDRWPWQKSSRNE